MILAWGREALTFFFNETYIPLLGPRAAWAMGSPFIEVWADAWAQAKPIIDDAFHGRPKHFVDLPWKLDSDRGAPDTWWSFPYSRVLDSKGEVAGLFIFTNETTGRVLSDAATKESQEALRRETKQQRLSLQHMPGFACILSGPEHVYDYVNDAYVALSGQRDFIGRTVRQVFPELEGQGFYELLDRVYSTGEPFSALALPIGLAGETRPRFIDFHYQPVRGEAAEVIGIFVGGYDITERVRAEQRREALLTLDERLRDQADTAELAFSASELVGEALGAMRVAYGVLDAEARTVTIERNWSLPGAVNIVGMHHFDEYGSHIGDLLRGEAVVNSDVTLDARSSANASAFRLLGIAAHLDVPVMEDGRAVAEMFVHSDRSRVWTQDEIALVRDAAQRTHAAIARRAAERELRSSEEFNRRVLASSPDCIKVLDLDARLHFMSEGGMCVMEVDDFCSIQGTYWPDFWQGDDNANALAAVEAAKRGGSGRFQGFATTLKGNPRWWDVTVTPINGPDGRPEQLLSVSRDISEQRRSAQRLIELNETLEARVTQRTADLESAHEQLRQSQKMEAVGQLTGGLAHDFNNLLAGISGSLELISMRLAQGRSAEVDRYVSAAQGAATRAAALTHRLLAFSRRQTLAPKPTDVKQLIVGMAELIARTVGPQIRLQIVNGVGLWHSLIDPSQLENAILNLCINARDAMPEGGVITIETANRWLDQRMAQEGGLYAGQYISLCVSDIGTGMPPDVSAKAFDPFFTTKPIGVGTGLGLSMIYGFAKQSTAPSTSIRRSGKEPTSAFTFRVMPARPIQIARKQNSPMRRALKGRLC